MMKSKQCTKCKEVKQLSEFYFNKQRKREESQCKICRTKRVIERRIEIRTNPEQELKKNIRTLRTIERTSANSDNKVCGRCDKIFSNSKSKYMCNECSSKRATEYHHKMKDNKEYKKKNRHRANNRYRNKIKKEI